MNIIGNKEEICSVKEVIMDYFDYFAKLSWKFYKKFVVYKSFTEKVRINANVSKTRIETVNFNKKKGMLQLGEQGMEYMVNRKIIGNWGVNNGTQLLKITHVVSLCRHQQTKNT